MKGETKLCFEVNKRKHRVSTEAVGPPGAMFGQTRRDDEGGQGRLAGSASV